MGIALTDTGLQAQQFAGVEAWPTPTVKSEAQTSIDPTPGQTGGTTLKGAVLEHGGVGGSLWPVTDSEPGRVARLRAIGNAVVPAWVLAGPFRFVQEQELERARGHAS